MRISARVAWVGTVLASIALAASAVAVSSNASAASKTTSTKAAAAAASTTFPTATGNKTVSEITSVKGTFDGKLVRYVGSGKLGDGSQKEGGAAMFEVADGGTIKNVIIGSPAADGIHCLGSCTIQNVWWEDVGEDAATALGQNSTIKVIGGGAKKAADKIFQNNAKGSTFSISGFYAEDFGKLYRACGNCKKSPQGKRTVTVTDVIVKGGKSSLVGINTNYGDTATLRSITVIDDPKKKFKLCVRYEGNNTGKEPKKLGDGPGNGCNYSASDITYK